MFIVFHWRRLESSNILTCDISDHFGCFVAVGIGHTHNNDVNYRKNPCNIQYSKLTKNDFSRINLALEAYDWTNFETLEVDQSSNVLIARIKKELLECKQCKHSTGSGAASGKRKKYKQPWMSGAILKSVKRLHAMYRLTIGLPSVDPVVVLYKRQRNILNKLKRKAKKIIL